MALTIETFSASTLRIHRVRCQPQHAACGPLEHTSAEGMVLPLRGLFVMHTSRDERIVADPCHALHFKAGEPYRVSHPVDGGDECLFIEPRTELAAEMAAWPKVQVLASGMMLERQLLAHGLARRAASALEAEERSLVLLGAMRPRPGRATSPRERSRRAEIVEAAQITLAREPGRAWTLGELARRATCSPFYLARSFRERVGMPLHRYELAARLGAALDPVLAGGEDLTTLALELGFSSHSHFTHAFRRAYGVTPSRMRERPKRARS